MRPSALVAVGVALPLLIALSRAPGGKPPPPAPRKDDGAVSIDLGRSGEQLRMRLATVSERPRAGQHAVSPRNPFAFSAGAEEVPQGVAQPNATGAASRVTDPPLAEPFLALIGIAEDQLEGNRERTAMIVGQEDALHFLREGETLEDRYRVQRIGEADVQLVDVTNADLRILSLAR